MPPKKTRRRKVKPAGFCGCPDTAKKISTKGRGRGWVCQSKTPKINKNGREYRPFVKAECS